MKSPLNRLLAHPFLRHNLVFFAGSMSLSVINYLYYPVLGRLLPLGAFGEVQVLLSLFLQASIYLGAVSLVAVNISANAPDDITRSRTIHELEKLSFLVMLSLGVVAMVLVAPLQAFLKFDSPLPFLGLIIAVVLGVPIALRNAYLQGRQDFAGLSIGGIIAASGKLAFSTLLVVAGFMTLGAIGGIILSELVAFVYIARRARARGLQYLVVSLRERLRLDALRPELKYGLIVLIISLITTFLFSGDIIVAKHYFSAAEAGAYAGVATVARIIFFATGSIAGVLLSSVKLGQTAANHLVLKRSLLLMLAIGGSAAALFALFPTQIIGTLMGARFLPEASLLPRLGLAMLLISTVNLFFYYLLALRLGFSVVIAALGAIVTFGLMLSRHATFIQIIDNLIYGSIFILVMLLAWSLIGLRQQQRASHGA